MKETKQPLFIGVCTMVGFLTLIYAFWHSTDWRVQLHQDGQMRVMETRWWGLQEESIEFRYRGPLRWEWQRGGQWREIPEEVIFRMNRWDME